MNNRHLWAVAVALLTIGTGCSRYADYCAAKADCLDGNDADITACKEELSGKAGYYLAYDCSDDWDAYFECLDAESDCVTPSAGSDVFTDCNGQGGDCECAEQESELLECVEDGSGYYEHAEPAPTPTTTTTTTTTTSAT